MNFLVLKKSAFSETTIFLVKIKNSLDIARDDPLYIHSLRSSAREGCGNFYGKKKIKNSQN